MTHKQIVFESWQGCATFISFLEQRIGGTSDCCGEHGERIIYPSAVGHPEVHTTRFFNPKRLFGQSLKHFRTLFRRFSRRGSEADPDNRNAAADVQFPPISVDNQSFIHPPMTRRLLIHPVFFLPRHTLPTRHLPSGARLIQRA